MARILNPSHKSLPKGNKPRCTLVQAQAELQSQSACNDSNVTTANSVRNRPRHEQKITVNFMLNMASLNVLRQNCDLHSKEQVNI